MSILVSSFLGISWYSSDLFAGLQCRWVVSLGLGGCLQKLQGAPHGSHGTECQTGHCWGKSLLLPLKAPSAGGCCSAKCWNVASSSPAGLLVSLQRYLPFVPENDLLTPLFPASPPSTDNSFFISLKSNQTLGRCSQIKKNYLSTLGRSWAPSLQLRSFPGWFCLPGETEQALSSRGAPVPFPDLQGSWGRNMRSEIGSWSSLWQPAML